MKYLSNLTSPSMSSKRSAFTVHNMQERGAPGSRLRKLASRVNLAIAVILVVLKLAAWLATGSVALLTSAVDALVDAASSMVTYFGVRYAERPPDSDHRFGHGKGEAIASFTQATFLAGAALVLTFQSVDRLIYPTSLGALHIGLGSSREFARRGRVSSVAMQSWVVQKTGSTAIAADRAHYLTDVAVNAAVPVALGVTKWTGWQQADPIGALAISAYMLWNAQRIAKSALVQLLDRELPREDRRRIMKAILGCEGARNIHDLRTRYSGDRIFVEYHLEVDGNLTVARGHAIGDRT